MASKKSETERFNEIVRAVKQEALAAGPGKRTGDQNTWEIQRRWAKANNRPFEKPEPGEALGLGSTAATPPPDLGPIEVIEEEDEEGRRPSTLRRMDEGDATEHED